MSDTTSLPLSGKTVLITGATRGIGYATAEQLAGMGADVIVHGRDPARVAAACARLGKASPNGDVFEAIADLSSQRAVRRLASDIGQRHERLDILINNAGLATRKREETVDGLERQLAVNHLASFLLTNLLLDKLRASAPARIVNVSSMAHHRAAFDLDDLNWERRRYSSLGAYGATKLANILFTLELARRLEGTGITANCLHPGVVATNIFTGLGVLGTAFGILAKPFLLSARRGAETTVFLASSPDAAVLSGQFFNECTTTEPARAATDESSAATLWETSARLTRLTD